MPAAKPAKKKPNRKAPAKKRPVARKKTVGRPTKMTARTVSKLEQAFLMGCTDEEACLSAGIGRSTLFRYCEENEEFRDRKEVLKQNPVLLARKVQLDELLEGNSAVSQKVLDRKEGSKVAVTGPNGGPIQTEHTDITKDMDPKEAQRIFMLAVKASRQ